MSRSRFAETGCEAAERTAAGPCSRELPSCRAVDDLAIYPFTLEAVLSASVPQGNPETKGDLHQPEARRHEKIAPGSRSKQRGRSERHQAQSHDRNDPNGKCSAGHDGGAIEQKPNPGERRHRP